MSFTLTCVHVISQEVTKILTELSVRIRKEIMEGKKELKKRAVCYIPWTPEKEFGGW